MESLFEGAWIVFELARQPFRTRAGDVHPIALMEASTRDLLGFWFVRSNCLHSDEKAVGRPFEQARRERRPQPTRLLAATDRTEQLVAAEAARLGLAVVRVEPERLHRFTADAEHIFQRGLAGFVPAESSRVRPGERHWRARRSAS